MTSRVQLSTSSGCRGVARLKMGSFALLRQNEVKCAKRHKVVKLCVCESEY